MRPLSKAGAAYFCGGFSGLPANSAQSMRSFIASIQTARSVVEGTPRYGQYRDALLREVDRSFFLGVSCFRRAHDLMYSSSAFWAHVSLYYASWFGAHGILGMLGCWVDGNVLIEVQIDAPGRQQFGIRRPTSPQGSHKNFWQAYYAAMSRYVNLVDPAYAIAASPVNSNDFWQIENRNKINYEFLEAINLVSLFEARFKPDHFPQSLPGDTATQYLVTRATLLLAVSLLTELSVNTDSFSSLGRTRAQSIDELIYNAAAVDLSAHSAPQQFAV